MEIAKITSRKIYEEIAEQIKQQVVSGKLKPGDKLPSTRELSEMYQVGRSTVREALSALKAMGLVEIHQGEGSYIRSIVPDDVEMPAFESLLMSRTTVLELLEARKALELANAALAAEKRTAEDLTGFESILDQMKQNIGNQAEGELADFRFHQALAQATHNSIMVRLLETISAQMEAAIRETRRLQMYSNKPVSEKLWMEHTAIYEAVRDADPAKAREQMLLHLQHVETMLKPYIS